MKSSAPRVIFLASVMFVGSVAVANVPGPAPTPSARLSLEMDVKPAEGQAGRFFVTSTITDLETHRIVGQPRLLIESDQPARVETGVDGKWALQISVAAGSTSRKAAYQATFTREGQVISKQRFAVDLNS
jgi:hypothetical protein